MDIIFNRPYKILKPLPISIVILLSLTNSVIFVFFNENIGILITASWIILPLIILMLLYPDFGFLITFVFLCIFPALGKYFIHKITDLQPGIILDFVFIFSFLTYVLNKKYKEINLSWQNPILIVLLFYFSYLIIMIGNPSGSISGWLMGMRFALREYIFIILSIFFFRKENNLDSFVKLWFIIACLAMLYGSYQQFFGIPEFELHWAVNNEQFYKLNFINGRWRIWSFLNNSTDFGIFMSASAVFFMIYCLHLASSPKRIFLILTSIFMLIAGSFSGTRTSTAIAVIGILLFALFEINNIKVILAMSLAGMTLLFIIFGPIHNPTIKRVRSTFFPEEDPSYIVREMKIEQFRGYIYSHPFGGGLNALNSEEHYLSGFKPDSYFLGLFLQIGIAGTLIFLLLLTTTIIEGVIKASKSSIRYIIIGLLTSFFSLTIAGYAQVGMYQFPHFAIFWGTIGFLIVNNKNIHERELQP